MLYVAEKKIEESRAYQLVLGSIPRHFFAFALRCPALTSARCLVWN